jgi:hypothetical protein
MPRQRCEHRVFRYSGPSVTDAASARRGTSGSPALGAVESNFVGNGLGLERGDWCSVLPISAPPAKYLPVLEFGKMS